MNVKNMLGRKGGKVHTISPDTNIIDAARNLCEAKVGALVVSDDGTTIRGILSERDIVRVVGLDGPAALGWPVSKVMTVDVHTCGLEDRVNELMSIMTERRIRHIPVLEDGKMVGLISIGDVVKNRMEEMEADSEAMHAYIAGAAG